MCPTYDVTVPIDSVVAEALDGTAATRLPQEPIALGRVTVAKDESGASDHIATVRVSTPGPTSAKQAAVHLVENMLFALAAGWNAFEIRVSRVHAEVVPQPAAPTTEPLGPLAAHAGARSSVSANLEKRKGSLERVRDALASEDAWKPHLRRALELNYLACRHHHWSTKFLLLAMALDMLTDKSVGPPPALLSTRLDGPTRKSVTTSIGDLLAASGLAQTDRERLLQYLSQAHAFPVSQQQSQYLRERGIEHDPEALKKWWGMRGRIAHGDDFSEEEVRREGEQLRIVLSQAFGAELQQC
jgi:hypothetical protein